MKRIVAFLKTTTLGGLFVLLPIVAVCLLLAKALHAASAIAIPIVDRIPWGASSVPVHPVLVAAILLAAISFLFGLFLRSKWARACGLWAERLLLMRIPGYSAMKGIARSFAASEASGSFQPAMLRSASGEREFAYLVEDHGDGFATVMLPWAPTPLVGLVKIVRRDQIEVLHLRLADVTRVLGDWGLGAHALLGKSRRPAPAPPP